MRYEKIWFLLDLLRGATSTNQAQELCRHFKMEMIVPATSDIISWIYAWHDKLFLKKYFLHQGEI